MFVWHVLFDVETMFIVVHFRMLLSNFVSIRRRELFFDDPVSTVASGLISAVVVLGYDSSNVGSGSGSISSVVITFRSRSANCSAVKLTIDVFIFVSFNFNLD